MNHVCLSRVRSTDELKTTIRGASFSKVGLDQFPWVSKVWPWRSVSIAANISENIFDKLWWNDNWSLVTWLVCFLINNMLFFAAGCKKCHVSAAPRLWLNHGIDWNSKAEVSWHVLTRAKKNHVTSKWSVMTSYLHSFPKRELIPPLLHLHMVSPVLSTPEPEAVEERNSNTSRKVSLH